MSDAYTVTLPSPLGPIWVTEQGGAIIRVAWTGGNPTKATPLLLEATAQLNAYFVGERTSFTLPLTPAGSPFHQQVFAAMQAIPHGETRTYGAIAKDLDTFGQPVGQACGSNPIPVIIPCHRVLSAEGLGGYSGAGGVETKIWLLRHENAYPFLL